MQGYRLSYKEVFMFVGDLREYDSIDKYEIQTLKFSKMACTYMAYFEYWVEALFERMMRLFVWENTYNEEDGSGIDPKEIEQRLIIDGKCFIAHKAKEEDITAFFGSMFGVTKYLDEWKYVNVRCPIWTGKRTIGKDAVLINNTAIRNASYMHINHYATMLAHNEVSIVDALINVRDAGGVPVAATEAQKQSITSYHTKLFNGEYGVVTDPAGLGVDYAGKNRETRQDIGALMETRAKLLRSFYSDMGVRSTFEKRSNVNSLEVDGDTSMLLLNISDMLHQREKACREVNKIFGKDWSVHVAEEIDYGAENQELINNVETDKEAIDNDVVE